MGLPLCPCLISPTPFLSPAVSGQSLHVEHESSLILAVSERLFESIASRSGVTGSKRDLTFLVVSLVPGTPGGQGSLGCSCKACRDGWRQTG